MLHPSRRPSKSVQTTTTTPKAPVFKTASGKLVTPKPGEFVKTNDVKREVDVCFVIDTTGSMDDKIAGLLNSLTDFVADLANLKLDWRVTCVSFGDLTVGDRVDGDLPFVTDVQSAQRLIRGVPRYWGGNNIGESSLEAVQAAMNKEYRQNAVKVLVLLTDEPPLIGQLTPASITKKLKKSEFVCFIVSRPGVFEAMAEENAGKWYRISSSMDTSGLLGFLRSLLRDVVKVSRAVHDLGGGSVSRYLEETKRLELGKGNDNRNL